MLSERRAIAPFGLEGGGPAAKGINLIVRRDGRHINMGAKATAQLQVRFPFSGDLLVYWPVDSWPWRYAHAHVLGPAPLPVGMPVGILQGRSQILLPTPSDWGRLLDRPAVAGVSSSCSACSAVSLPVLH